MLQDRIISTLKFFDLQDVPLTLLELHEFLVAEPRLLRKLAESGGEVKDLQLPSEYVALDELLTCLEKDSQAEVGCFNGYYFLTGREELVRLRLANYEYGIVREKLIKKYIPFLGFIPFVRGVGLAGSQALGQQKKTSDIDLFVVTHPDFLWLTRTLVTGYFQILGVRRHGKRIANRFCLNHYIAAPKEVGEFKNMYTASEYIKLRPLVYGGSVQSFQYNNKEWISQLFPNAMFQKPGFSDRSVVQQMLELCLDNAFGRKLEQLLKKLQIRKIRTQEKFIVVTDNELSFHPESKQTKLLEKYFRGFGPGVQTPKVTIADSGAAGSAS